MSGSPSEGANVLASAKAAAKGALMSRVNAVAGGSWDVAKTGWKFTGEALGTKNSQGAPGALGVARDIGKAVWGTIADPNRGVMRIKGTDKLSGIGGEGMWNPLRIARRTAAGVTEVMAETSGGIVGLMSERFGNAIKGVIRGGARAIGGALLGDYGQYLGGTSSNVNLFKGGGGGDAPAATPKPAAAPHPPGH